MRAPVARLTTRLFAPEVGAAAFRLRLLADALGELGFHVDVVTTRPPGSPALADGRLRVSRWPVLRDANGNVRGYVQYLSFDLPALVRLLVRRRPELHISEPPPTTGVVVRLVATLQRVPYVYYAADVWSEAAGSAGAPAPLVAVLRRLESWVLRGAAAVLAVSQGVADQVVALGADPQRVTVVGNGVDTRTFCPEGPSRSATTPYFVYTGTMSEWQGADVFIRALALVRERGHDVRLCFLGQGTDVEHLRSLAESLVPGAVDFGGVVPPETAAEHLRGAVAALVSIKPGLGYDFAKPTKIYAATACGSPVVFAGRGASRELVLGEGLGWAPGYEPHQVADAMVAALTAPGDERLERSGHVAAWSVANASLAAAGRRAAEVAAGCARPA